MTPSLNTLLTDLQNQTATFTDVLSFIDSRYSHTPTAFKNGEAYNEATQNQGSAKVFSFARIQQLSVEETLLLFAEHYKAVLDHPDATDHQNIRQFMAGGWQGVVFEGTALTPR